MPCSWFNSSVQKLVLANSTMMTQEYQCSDPAEIIKIGKQISSIIPLLKNFFLFSVFVFNVLITFLHQPKFTFVSANFFLLVTFPFESPRVSVWNFSFLIIFSINIGIIEIVISLVLSDEAWNLVKYYKHAHSLVVGVSLMSFFSTYNFLICIVDNILNLVLTKNKIACFNVQGQAHFDQRFVFLF